jgi:ubiquinone/menaquinone biosynthesis C-methylase UbiE
VLANATVYPPAPKAMLTDRAYYEDQARRALQTDGHFQCSEPTIIEAVIRMVRTYLTTAADILDVGCGANLVYDRFLAETGKRPICLDFTLGFLQLAPKDARMPLIQGNATALPFASASFDAVICSETLEHIERDDLAAAEMARVLRPGGVLIVTVPNLWNASRLIQMVKTGDFTIRMISGHFREYTSGRLARVLGPYFTIEDRLPVTFGWTGKLGSPVDWLIRSAILRCLSKSIAVVARRK